METRQQLLDSITSHLSLFHISSSKPSLSISTPPRSAILRWFSSLPVASRRATLTVVDQNVVSVVIEMLNKLHKFGHGVFFLLPDVEESGVPSVLFRRSGGLLARVEEGNEADWELGGAVMMFCSDVGLKAMDAVTVSEEFVSDVDRFVEVMDKISGGKFLTGNDDINSNKPTKWPELAWLQDIGYYTLEAFLANRLEIAIRVSWRESTGGGRKGKTVNKGISKDKVGVSSNVFWRKKGCLDWWARLDQSKRENIINSFLNQTTKSMANEIVKRYEIDSKRNFYFFNHQSSSDWKTTKQSFFRKNRNSISLDDISILPYRRKKPLPGVITRLVALFEIFLLKRNIFEFKTEALFFTTLSMAGSVSDFVLNKLREVLMSVSIECVNLELLEDSGACRPSLPVENKAKKKTNKSRRPKSSSKPSKVEENKTNDCSTSSSSQSKIPSVNKEPVLEGKESSDKISVSKENKENNEVSAENKAPCPISKSKTKNKRKGKNNNKSSTSSKSKTLESKTKNPNSSTNNTNSSPSLNNTTNTNTPTTSSSNHTETNNNNNNQNNNDNNINNTTNNNNIPSTLNNSNNPSKNTKNLSSNTEPTKPLNKLEPPQQIIQTQAHPQMRETQTPYFEIPPSQIISPLNLPLSYDWPPVYRNFNKFMPPTQEYNQYFSDDASDPYWYYSEEESDSKYGNNNSNYNSKYDNIFGGGIMYWSPSEYNITGNNNTGPFSSRPPSLSSDDSAWARHEADIVQIIDEMTILPPNPDPSSEDNQSIQNQTLMQPDPLPYSMLRPIIVPNRMSSSRRGSRSELNKHLMSPCLNPSISSSSARRIKRPPSPVVLCVPRVPRPPPPSPVESSSSRRRSGSGFPGIVRSGSSSPRNWAVRSLGFEDSGNWEKGRGVLDGPEVVWTGLVHKGCVDRVRDAPFVPVLQEQIIKISQWDQHPDIALPLQPPDSVNSPARLSMHNLLHEEIDYFSKQVGAGNISRKPYINWAINRVTKCLQVLWPRSRTSLFGSNATGLALPTSDVDLVVSLPPVRNLEPIKEAGILEGRNGIKETCLQHAARYLSNQEWVRSDSLKTIENTAIPVIMLIAQVPFDANFCEEAPLISDIPQEYTSTTIAEDSTSSGIEKNCTVVKSIRLDISFQSSSHTGLQTSELVRELTEQFPACVPLALILKKFLADRSLDHSYSGGLSSYCLVLLITRFLQHEHHVSQIINQNLGRLLMDFLYFFGNVFDPRQMRMSIQGRGLYMNRERGLSIDPIHIDDPLFPTNNVGRNCFRIHQCIKAFADAFTMLENEVENISADVNASSAASQFRLLRKIIPSIDSSDE